MRRDTVGIHVPWGRREQAQIQRPQLTNEQYDGNMTDGSTTPGTRRADRLLLAVRSLARSISG